MSLAAPTGNLQVRSVLVATDFSEASEKALRHALAITRHYEAKLYLVNVVSSLGFNLVGADAVNAAGDAVLRDARQLEDHLVQTGALAGLPHEVIVLQGDVCEELERVISQEQVDLVVIGTHARRGLGKLLLGSVAERIFHRAECLVLTVGPGSLQDSPVGSARAIRPFLFATDFSEASLHALPYAVSAANHFETTLVLLHVAPVVPTQSGLRRPAAGDVAHAREDVRVASLQKLEELASRSPSLASKPEFVVEFGLPSEKILDVADTLQADAIILGLRRSERAGTAYDVACGACCAVLTVRN